MGTQLGRATHELERLKTELASLRRENQRLNTLAYRDVLTGLRNRRFLTERLDEELTRLDRGHARHLGVISVDVNHFKQLNDRCGHAAGDAALLSVAVFLDAQMRGNDLCCRVGGDEFTIILPDTDPPQLCAVAQRLKDRMHLLHELTIAVGTASWAAGENADCLLDRADVAMYADKRFAQTHGSEAASAA